MEMEQVPAMCFGPCRAPGDGDPRRKRVLLSTWHSETDTHRRQTLPEHRAGQEQPPRWGKHRSALRPGLSLAPDAPETGGVTPLVRAESPTGPRNDENKTEMGAQSARCNQRKSKTQTLLLGGRAGPFRGF